MDTSPSKEVKAPQRTFLLDLLAAGLLLRVGELGPLHFLFGDLGVRLLAAALLELLLLHLLGVVDLREDLRVTTVSRRRRMRPTRSSRASDASHRWRVSPTPSPRPVKMALFSLSGVLPRPREVEARHGTPQLTASSFLNRLISSLGGR
jgi:hypothetical protein